MKHRYAAITTIVVQPCNENCMNAYTEVCTCECRGENHGIKLTSYRIQLMKDKNVRVQ